jgi:hypothetical protein
VEEVSAGHGISESTLARTITKSEIREKQTGKDDISRQKAKSDRVKETEIIWP